MTDQLLTNREVAAWMRVTPRTVERWRERGQVAFTRTPTGRIRYRRADILAALEATPARPARIRPRQVAP
jgi:excisionase family DNA binding protein